MISLIFSITFELNESKRNYNFECRRYSHV